MRVLITGISGELAGLVAAALAERPDVERVVGVDDRAPRAEVAGTEFVRADIRSSVVTQLVTAGEIDSVVHLGVSPAPGPGGRAKMKENNVIGTMQLLAACQKADGLRRFVLRSSTAVYGSDHHQPAFLREEAPLRAATSGYAKDLSEVESYTHQFARRHAEATTTVLRLANLLGGGVTSLFARYLASPVVPTVLGYDPRLQFLHPDDAVEVIVRAVTQEHPGTFNVSGPGVLYLSQAIRRAGRVPGPIASPFVSLAAGAVRRLRRIDFSPEQLKFLLYGRVADITDLRHRFGYEPRYTTAAAFEDYLARRRPGWGATRGADAADRGRPDARRRGAHAGRGYRSGAGEEAGRP